MSIIKHYLDSFIVKLSDNVIAALNWIMTISAALTLMDWLDIGSKAVTLLITLGVGLLSLRHYMLKNRLKEKEIQLKDQELYRAITENKQRERK